MLIDLYHVDQGDNSRSLEAEGVELATCFPDDPDEAALVAADLLAHGESYYGGGAAPLFLFIVSLESSK